MQITNKLTSAALNRKLNNNNYKIREIKKTTITRTMQPTSKLTSSALNRK